jgi:ATP-binding cassette, subfamily B, bacterial
MLRVTGRLARFDLRRFVIGGLLWQPVSVLPLISGLVLELLFDRISHGRLLNLHQAWWLCGAFVGVELARGVSMAVAWTYGVYWWDAAATVLRGNILRSLLSAPGPAAGRLPGSSGESVSRLRDDVASLVDFVDQFIALTGALLFAIGAFVIMARIDPRITLVLVVPMVAVAVLSTAASATVKRLHRAAQASGAAVTGYLGEIFANVLAIKAAGAESPVLQRLNRHNHARRAASVRDGLAVDLLSAGTAASVQIGIGLVLLLAAGAMRQGRFTVGDLALFTTYVGWLTALPQSIGSLLYQLPQAMVGAQRLGCLLASGQAPTDLVRHTDVWFSGPPAGDPGSVPSRGDPLRTLDVQDLTVRFNGGERGVHGVSLRLERGSFCVITGAVGSGKTTVIRALLGLVPADSGTFRWNGRAVKDPGTFLAPPRASYASQQPRLFSVTLRENLLLGWPGDGLERALYLAALNEDVARMPGGLNTLVGSRGVRLSGGQVQRVNVARALVRSPELLILDDVSSALDVETEALLWGRLASAAREGAGPGTLLVVSHRRAVLERADQVIVLDRGRVVGQGRLPDLLRDCAEMRRLWTEEIQVEETG